MERIATQQQPEYVDIVLGYHHILLFSIIFGGLVFGTGYFVGYHFAADQHTPRTMVSTPGPSAAKRPVVNNSEAVTVPALITDPGTPAGQDIVKDMERYTGVEPGTAQAVERDAATAENADKSAATAAAVSEPDAARGAESPAANPAGAKPAELAQPATTPATETAKPAKQVSEPAGKPHAEVRPVAPPKAATRERQAVETAQLSKRPATPSRKPVASPARGNIYLQVSSFGTQQDAQKLIEDLTGEGYRALIDNAVVSGRHTVLVGPFADFKTAVGQAKQLKQNNHEAFPVRR